MPQNISLELVLILLIFILICIVFLLLFKNGKSKDENSLRLLQSQIHSLNKSIDFKLSEINRGNTKQSEINQHISLSANKKIEQITIKLGELEETNKKIQDIGGQLEGLENILKNPKQRGILGEYFLESILKNILPPENYTLQYKFQSGEIVDSVIFVQDKIIPIDSKFSLENYNKIIQAEEETLKKQYIKDFRNDLKKRIDETSKYIKPSEKTMDFAFMFIPSEAIYYDLLVNKIGAIQENTIDLVEYAFKEKKVIIISPTSFYAYLQTVLQGLRALRIEEKAEEIKKGVAKLSRHLSEYEIYFQKLGNTLGTSVSHYNTAYKKFNMVEKDVMNITENKEEIKKIELTKPDV